MRATALLLVVLAGCFLIGLGDPGLWPKDEARYAQAAREMRDSGDWLVPTLGGETRLNKPPLFYWVGAVSQAVFGETEFAVRLPAALAGIASALLAYFLGRRLFGLRAGIVAALVYATSIMPAGMGRLGHPDSLLSLFVCGAIVLLFLAWREGFRRRSLVLAAWALMGLGFLVKGPHGVVLPLLVIVVFLAVHREWRAIGRLEWAYGPPLALLPVFAWAAVVVDRVGILQILDWWRESVGRFAGSTSFHGEPLWYFLPVVLGGLFPWVLRLPEVARWLWHRPDPSPAKTLLWVWPVVVFVFFSLSPNKAAGYVLPAFLPLAVAAGAALSGPRRRLALAATIGLAAVTMVVGLAVVAPVRNREKSLRGPGLAALDLLFVCYCFGMGSGKHFCCERKFAHVRLNL
ncbi:MAG: glycosyltransferase family 39 protein, partial [Planctomycetota bacterium]